jgi:hypothetical protein
MMGFMDEPRRIVFPDSIVTGLVAESAAGPIYVTSAAENQYSGLAQTTLSAIDLSGAIRWHRVFEGTTGAPRVAGDGSIWLAHDGPDGTALRETGRDGTPSRTIAVTHRPGEKLGQVVILPGGFCTAWTSGPPYQGARVDRRDGDGGCLWSTTIPPARLAHRCVMEASAETGWRSQPKAPWIPGTFRLHHWEPLLVSGDRILVSYAEGRSGLGISYFLSAGTGEVINSTGPVPLGRKAICGPGEFLIGVHGYDEFATVRYTRAGDEAVRWPTHGAVLIDHAGKMLGIEHDNRSTAQAKLRRLGQDGSLSDGPAVAGGNLTHPALDRDGTAVFWRDGRLLAVDAGLTLHELYSGKAESSPYLSRTLLLEDGIVAFATNGDVLLFRTALGPLEESAWPCGDGNLNGNPAVFTQ